jgi:hypothetical protein
VSQLASLHRLQAETPDWWQAFVVQKLSLETNWFDSGLEPGANKQDIDGNEKPQQAQEHQSQESLRTPRVLAHHPPRRREKHSENQKQASRKIDEFLLFWKYRQKKSVRLWLVYKAKTIKEQEHHNITQESQEAYFQSTVRLREIGTG